MVYPQTVAARIAQNFRGELCGADIAFSSDLPRAAGLSSSSALVVGLFTALSDVNALAARPEYAADIRGPEDLGAGGATGRDDHLRAGQLVGAQLLHVVRLEA